MEAKGAYRDLGMPAFVRHHPAATAGEARRPLHKQHGNGNTVTFPANGRTRRRCVQPKGSIRVQTNHDPDAEDEKFTLEFTAWWSLAALT